MTTIDSRRKTWSDPGFGTVSEALRAPGLDRVDARVLLEHVLGMSHAALIANPDRALDPDARRRFAALAARRAAGEPVAYLVGWREFYGHRFSVGPAVLIPRPETELLVDLALQRLTPGATRAVLDLGTGSGNIALTLALERPHCSVTAIDASAGALGIAAANRHALAATNVELLRGDWFEPVAARRFDLIVSNPPYVAEGDPHLTCGDLRFEPPAALRAGRDGLDAIRAIATAAPCHLHRGGWLMLEHGCDQAEACTELLASAGFAEVKTFDDLAGLPRVTAGLFPA